MAMTGPAIIVLGESGRATAARVKAAVPGARIHGFIGRVYGAEQGFTETGPHLRRLFAAGAPLIGVCAAGVLIRSLAPAIADKTEEPPVLAVAEDGSCVVPLLGGHSGANRLARIIADALGAAAAVTTAGDLRFGIALDDPPAGWALANPQQVKEFVGDLLAGETVRLAGDAPWLAASALPFDSDGALAIRVTDSAASGDARTLIYHPATLVLGVGCERDAAAEEVIGLARDSLREAGLAAASVACVVSIDVKADEAAVHALADSFGAPARFFPPDRLEQETPRLARPSEAVFRAVGCHGVAEGAALAAVGSAGALLIPKRTRARATCAVARAPAPIDAAGVGRPRGRLAIVGIGPGAAEWRTPEAERLICEADHIVGYRRYLDLLGPAMGIGRRHAFALGEEEARARKALDLAGAGCSVALVSSGDAGIYAMASLVFELLDKENRVDWRRVAITVAPGISALQAAAARIGAPLGHDFCAVSLSDLMTPWEVIEKRIAAAAAGDFVIALYNPASGRRTWQFDRARDLLRRHRKAETPVVIARNLGRTGESVAVVPLGDLTAESLDMLTLVLVGTRETRVTAGTGGREWVYTPRGYRPSGAAGCAAS